MKTGSGGPYLAMHLNPTAAASKWAFSYSAIVSKWGSYFLNGELPAAWYSFEVQSLRGKCFFFVFGVCDKV